MATAVRLPPIATDTTDGTLVRWLVAVGDRVAEGQVVAEVDTAKVLFEVEAPASGVVISRRTREDARGERRCLVGSREKLRRPRRRTHNAARRRWSTPAPAATCAPPRSCLMAEKLGVDLAHRDGPGGRIMKDGRRRATAEPGPRRRAQRALLGGGGNDIRGTIPFLRA
jgi:pyruvate/2-oxoglutarate dehydrogenase complex dihydrolipoamide acyltransferase (E2) component